MNNNEDGGAAFPAAAFDPRDSSMCWQDGMSLRDYFAAKAPLDSLKFSTTADAAKFAGMSEPTTDDELVIMGFACAARAAYIYADAMLKAREQ